MFQFLIGNVLAEYAGGFYLETEEFQFLIGNVLAYLLHRSGRRTRPVSIPYRQCLGGMLIPL